MLSSTADRESTRNRLNRLSSSSSSSTSSSSSPSPFCHNTQKAKTMEEVWKDINLASLHDNHSSDPNPNFILQDFFARPFNKDPPKRLVSTTTKNAAVTAAAPATVLSLNSIPVGFDFLENSDPLIIRPVSSRLPHHHRLQFSTIVSSFNNNNNNNSDLFGCFDSSSGLPCFGKKRVQESDSSSCDRRHKRMIKNRESAARSRARKQAYTQQLENTVKELEQENARLRSQLEELYLAAAAQLPKKHMLHRTSTAPF
ncbi:protein FD [Jatropha curcas]|uniref:protein FD n=1 Tax=Jatropha curcas TaxID=180498 RepID=UPI0009D6A222|nr:protein FD [Jatropha curcas]